MARGSSKADFGKWLYDRKDKSLELVSDATDPATQNIVKAMKGNEEKFQQFFKAMANAQDGTSWEAKASVKERFLELPDEIKALITVPNEEMSRLIRGVFDREEPLKEARELYEGKYERLINSIDKTTDLLWKQRPEGMSEEDWMKYDTPRIKELQASIDRKEQELKDMEEEERQYLNTIRYARDVMSFTYSHQTASKFGNYYIQGDKDVAAVGAIIDCRKAQKVLEVAFTRESIDEQYRAGVHRLWTMTEGEMMAIGVQLTQSAERQDNAFYERSSKYKDDYDEKHRYRY